MNDIDEIRAISKAFTDAIADHDVTTTETDMAGKTGYPYIAPPSQPEPPNNNATFWIGLIACVLVAVAAQAHTLPEPWSHVVSVAGTVGAAVNGFLIRR